MTLFYTSNFPSILFLSYNSFYFYFHVGNPSKNGVGSLVLGPLRTDQAGRYTCVAKNDAGNVEYDFELKVKSKF